MLYKHRHKAGQYIQEDTRHRRNPRVPQDLRKEDHLSQTHRKEEAGTLHLHLQKDRRHPPGDHHLRHLRKGHLRHREDRTPRRLHRLEDRTYPRHTRLRRETRRVIGYPPALYRWVTNPQFGTHRLGIHPQDGTHLHRGTQLLEEYPSCVHPTPTTVRTSHRCPGF